MPLDELRNASICPPFLYELEVPKPLKTSPFVVPNIVKAAINIYMLFINCTH